MRRHNNKRTKKNRRPIPATAEVIDLVDKDSDDDMDDANRIIRPLRPKREPVEDEKKEGNTDIGARAGNKKKMRDNDLAVAKKKPRLANEMFRSYAESTDESEASDGEQEQSKQPSNKVDVWEKPLPQLMANNFISLEKKNRSHAAEAERILTKLDGEDGFLATEIRQKLQSYLNPELGMLVDRDLGTQLDEKASDKVKKAWESIGLGSKRIKEPQDRVIWQIVNSKRDVIFTAPCGFGKSVCFAVPALMSGGITLVVVPLKSLADSLELDLRNLKGIRVEQLLNEDQRKQRMAIGCHSRLVQLNNDQVVETPLVLVTLWERINYPNALEQLGDLSKKGRLTRIVVDEFDYLHDCGKSFREDYLVIFKTLRENCRCRGRPVQIVCLSATCSLHTIQKYREGSTSERAIYFRTNEALPELHRYSCEAKISLAQVATRITSILHQHQESQESRRSRPKCICYCLTQANCKMMAGLLKANGFTTAEYHSKVDDVKLEATIGDFRDGRIEILCATTALVRGYHDSGINFIFHAVLPLSLRELVQETGRASRGVVPARCYVFVSQKDRGKAERVLLGCNSGTQCALPDSERDEKMAELNRVYRYASEGLECRKLMLSEAAVDLGWNQGQMRCKTPHLCDNCSIRVRAGWNEHAKDTVLTDVDATYPIRTALENAIPKARAERFSLPENKIISEMKRDLERGMSEGCFGRGLLTAVETLVKSFLTEDLVRMMRINYATMKCAQVRKIDGNKKSYTDWQSVHELLKLLKDRTISFSLRNVTILRTVESPRTVVTHVETPDRLFPKRLDLNGRVRDISRMPFLIQFEYERLRKKNEASGCKQDSVLELFDKSIRSNGDDAASVLLEVSKSERSILSYESMLKESLSAEVPIDSGVSFGGGVGLRFIVQLSNEGELSLLPPQTAHGRRVFRQFGSHRFLWVNVKAEVSKKARKAFFKQPLSFLGRRWKLCWAKVGSSPQCYVMFAQDGVGIGNEEEFTVDQFHQFFIPKEFNPQISIGKFMKRLKLSFSRTEAAGSLPASSVVVLPPFPGDNDIDGGGLVSKQMLDFIWSNWCSSRTGSKECERRNWDRTECPFSGFQGRLGGFKGEWVLDPALDGMILHCRESQLKYDVPQRSRGNGEQGAWDPLHDVMEVCSWDKKLEGKLNVRCVQLLEAGGVSHEAFRDVVGPGLTDLANLFEDHVALLDFVKSRALRMYEKEQDEGRSGNGAKDTMAVFEMLAADVAPNEPVLAERASRFVKKELERVRAKAQYPISSCCSLRMHGDHTQLLHAGEAFVAFEHGAAKISDHILAMRSPSYFPGDMRKLSVVSLKELNRRAELVAKLGRELDPLLCRTADQMCSFFANVKNSIVMRATGRRSEADKMSGGDHDGDYAWVCWNERFISEFEQVPAQETAGYEVEKSDEEKAPFWESSIDDMLSFIFEHKDHQSHLGFLSELQDKMIDKYGFGHELTIDLGRASFLQVDVPYKKVELRKDINVDDFKRDWPHWKRRENQKQYQSDKALGVLYNLVGEAIDAREKAVSGNKRHEPDERILKFSENASKTYSSDKLNTAHTRSRKILNGYLDELQRTKQMTKEERIECLDRKADEAIRLFDREESDVECQLLAAVLYKEAILIGKDDNAVSRFVWKIALPYLCHIRGGKKSLSVASKNVSALR